MGVTNKTKVRPYMPAGMYVKAYAPSKESPKPRTAKARIHAARVRAYYATKPVAYKWCYNHLQG